MKTLVVVQARMRSSRLPGKVMLPLAGAPLLARMIERVRGALRPFDVVIATTTSSDDDPIADLARSIDVRVYRGHPTDCLDRHHRAAVESGADRIVKIPSDCPLIDPKIIDRVLASDQIAFDYVSNLHPATYPDGNDVEIMSAQALAIAADEAKEPHEREHTTPFFWERPDRFALRNVTWESGRDLSRSHRFTIDYREDYELIAAVYDALWDPRRHFDLDDILNLLVERPYLGTINARYAGETWMTRRLRTMEQRA